ncbi:MAG TPA: OsmC family protein [Candidatus Saccharimonadales bacterium]|jgi:putative redox protein|nr:OsmC family protein [Candidatus Saccharimonadales bacterium]
MDTARVQWVGKERFIAQSPSGHIVALDSDRASNGAPGPMELLLISLGACTATDIVSILAKKRQQLDSLEVEVSGERSEVPPRVWTKLEILYKLRGTLEETAVQHAIHLSEEKYCSVAAMLRKTAAITSRIQIENR